MDLQELNELNFNNVGDWPGVVKFILVLLLCGAVAAGWYFYDIEGQFKNLEREQREEKDLREDFERKQARAANLDAYRAQLAEMQESFGAMLRQLPNRTEVADLLVDVSQTGLAAGLEFELFQPQAEIRREFYSELPINLQVTGTYHEFGEFVSGLAALPRIVTIHNVSIAPRATRRGGPASGDTGGELVMKAQAKTYRYLDEAGN